MLRTRVISVIISLPIMIAALYLGGKTLAFLTCLLSIVGLHEYYNAFKNADFKPNALIGFFGAICYYAIITINKNSIVLLSSMLFIILILLFFDIIKRDRSILDIAITILGLIYIPFLFSNIQFLQKGNYGRALVLLPFVTAWLSDTLAYFAGINFGKHKLCPKISPNKTIEGALGGIAGSTLFCFIAGAVFYKTGISIPLFHYLIVGILCGITGQIGDLFASSIKRFCKIKDFGRILPGHGGILDRFDSILFTAPTVYIYFKLFFKILSK
ncbi:MAG: phosphatidate cytidylyltransferase [Firmicutes bacterium]|nr:phosphatidate cytidylyltransferase [Bacillota bacterium]